MDSDVKTRRVAELIEHLAVKVAELDREEIEFQAHRAYQALLGNPIRDYVPILVEHDAKEHLRRLIAGDPTMPGTDGGRRPNAAAM